MAFTEALRMLITADTGQAVAGIKAVGTATDRELGKSTKTIDKWGRGLTTAGAGMIAFGGAALLGLGKAAMMSEDANLSVVKLENTLGNMPKLAGENKQSFIDLAAAIQDKTAADADQIVEAEALLGTFNLTGKEIRSITPLVVDLSRKFGIDMNSAAQQVGKALDGNVGALKRNGISIDENLFKTDRYAAVTKALRDQVGGFAEEEGKTFAGSLERMKNELGDVAEGVGVGAVDAFTSLFGVVDGGLDKLEALSPATQSAIGKFATFGSVALIAAGGVSFLLGQVIKASQNFSIARDAVANFAGAGGLGRLARVSLVVGGFLALREVLQAFDRDLEGIDVSTLENELLDLAETGEIAGDQLAGIFEDFAAAIESGDPEKLEAVSNQLGKVDEALAQLASRDPQAAAASFGAITDRLKDMGASSDQIKAFFDDYIAATASADTSSRTAAGGVDELGGAMGDQADDTTAAADALQEYLDTLSGMFDPLFSATDALMDNHDAQVKVTEAEMKLAEAIRDHGPASLEAAQAQDALTEAQLGAGKSALDVTQAMAELKAGVEDGTVSVSSAKEMLQTWVDQGLISAGTAAFLAGEFDKTTDAANDLGATDPNVSVSESGSARVQGSLSKVQQAAINAGRQRPNVRVSATDRASGILGAVSRLIHGIPSSRTFTFNARVTGLQELNRARALTGRQHGGSVRAREAYLVGEAGPEVLLMGSQSGTIVPNLGHPVGGGVVSGGAGSVTNNHFHIAGSVIAERDLVATINRQLARGAINKNGRTL